MFATYQYPSPYVLPCYDEIDRLAGALDAEVAVFHSSIVDPRELPVSERWRCGGGFWVPWPAPARFGDADVEHFRVGLPDRYARFVAAAIRLYGCDEAALWKRDDVRAAVAYARMIQAWAADAVVVRFVNNQALFGVVACHLLGLPLVVALEPQGNPGEAEALRLPVTAHASLVIVPCEADRQGLVQQFGAVAEERAVVSEGCRVDSEAVVHAMQRLLATSPAEAAAARGPGAAFVGPASTPVARRCGVKPFVILGAERTGSNMLVDMLSAQPLVASGGELFNPRAARRREITWVEGIDFDREEELCDLRDDDPGALHERLYRHGASTGAAWVGYKLLYFHGVIDNRIVGCLQREDDLHVIHLYRRARLRRWLSHFKAQQIDSWYTRKGAAGEQSVEPLRLDVVETMTDFAYVELMEERFAATFVGHRVLEFDYDDLVADLAGAREQLSAFLDVPLAPLQARSRKTGASRLENAISNLGELHDALRGTRWAASLDE